MTKRDLAKDDQGTQGSFGLIVCRRHTRIIQKDKPLVLMLQNSLLQCHLGQLLPVTCGPGQMRLTILLRTGDMSFIPGITIRHQRARKALAQHIAGHLAGA